MEPEHVRPRVYFDFSIGNYNARRIVIELYDDKAPKTCKNFLLLINGTQPPLNCAGAYPGGFPRYIPVCYFGTAAHRLVPDVLVQFGDMSHMDGRGGILALLAHLRTMPCENLKWRRLNVAGLVCMASRGPDQVTSQFFITLGDCEHLAERYTCFGIVVEGMDVLAEINRIQVDDDDRPRIPIIVMRCAE
ncbi:cyclophilin-like domain-containing protein [Sphaerosporella brunnea]|uniref:Peptidyl-prolyl cis-trans isomerase n=1 Tax=Sphaerosporella brunnea TaxID=1250544 RepID=A0A5J5EUD9_9PEZI|nr:cyclophilin-like domain-containing protein [Sphaerosporella brunnea]